MATTQAVYTEAQTQAMMDDVNLNPTSTEDAGEVQITLTYKGLTINPATIFDALQTIGDVQSDFVCSGNRYNFIITPAT
jgi:hypothetical protein